MGAGGDVFGDSNCNGVWGYDLLKLKSYEDELCAGTGQRGLIMLGDSATAHFHVPEQFMVGRSVLVLLVFFIFFVLFVCSFFLA